MKKRLEINIFGQVQGVFFRNSIKDLALNSGLTGWVKNEPDLSVKITMEGEEAELEKALLFCQAGTKKAKVKKVEVKWDEATDEFKEFKIIY